MLPDFQKGREKIEVAKFIPSLKTRCIAPRSPLRSGVVLTLPLILRSPQSYKIFMNQPNMNLSF